MAKRTESGNGVLLTNKKAFHDYLVIEAYEAGIKLHGTEVKSCRERAISVADSYVKIEKGQVFIYNVTIASYSHGNVFNHTPRSVRKLLMHKREILKLSQLVKEKGYTIIPLKFYLKHGLVKVEIGLCKGKTHGDKRDTLRERQDSLDARRAIQNHKG
jgi:SsrA-binding protein